MADERQAIDPAEMVETVKVKDDKAPGGYVVINASDFDETKHTKLTERQEAAAEKKAHEADKDKK